MQYSIDSLLHRFYDAKKGHPKNQSLPSTPPSKTALPRILRLMDSKFRSLLCRYAFNRLAYFRRPRVQALLVVERMVAHRLSCALLSLRSHKERGRGSLLRERSRINLPVAMVQRIVSRKEAKVRKAAFDRLCQYQVYLQKAKTQIQNLEGIVNEYIKRKVLSEALRMVVLKCKKHSAYRSHLFGLEYSYECIRMRVIFDAFARLTIRTLQRNIGQLEKERGTRKEQSRSVLLRRAETVNEWRRRISNLQGQISENQIHNSRRRINASRDHGIRLTRLNETLRALEAQRDTLAESHGDTQSQIRRKETALQRRQKSSLSLQKLRDYYDKAESAQDRGEQIVPPKDLSAFNNTLQFAVHQNAVLKQQLSLYEGRGVGKSENYLLLSNENNWLKDLVSSIILQQVMAWLSPGVIDTANRTIQQASSMKQELARLPSGSPP